MPSLILFLLKYFLSNKFLRSYLDDTNIKDTDFSFIFSSNKIDLDNNKEYKLSKIPLTITTSFFFLYLIIIYVLFKLMMINLNIFDSSNYIDIYVLLGVYLLCLIFYLIRIKNYKIYNKLYLIYNILHFIILFVVILFTSINFNINNVSSDAVSNNDNLELTSIIFMLIYLIIDAIFTYIFDNSKLKKKFL